MTDSELHNLMADILLHYENGFDAGYSGFDDGWLKKPYQHDKFRYAYMRGHNAGKRQKVFAQKVIDQITDNFRLAK